MAKVTLPLMLLAFVLVACPTVASAADHTVAPQSATFDCSAVRAGDTVTLPAGARGPLVIRQCKGTKDNPIVIQNDPAGNGPAVIRRTSGGSGGFVFTCADCVGVVIDGTNKWRGAPNGQTYGIVVTMTGGGSPSAFMKFSGLSRFVTVTGVEIDGAWPKIANNGVGILLNDKSKKAAALPNTWWEGFTFDGNYIHDTQGEGLYIGPNWYDGSLPLRDIVISGNVIEDAGWEGIQLKSAVGGTNLVHHNIVRRVGKESNHGQLSGISMLNGNGRIYNNWVESAGDTGIRHFISDLPRSYDGQTSEIFNNVVVNTGLVRTTPGHGIASNNRAGAASPVARIYHNTVVDARDSGIFVGGNASGGFVRDNVIAGARDKPVIAPPGVSQSNNLVGPVSDMAFVDADGRNFRLRSASPARNAATGGFPDADYDGVHRPQDGKADQGAFEFNNGEVASQPAAPANLVVE